jgi:hypothetical protein
MSICIPIVAHSNNIHMITSAHYVPADYLKATKYTWGFLSDLKNLSVPESKKVFSTDKS